MGSQPKLMEFIATKTTPRTTKNTPVNQRVTEHLKYKASVRQGRLMSQQQNHHQPSKLPVPQSSAQSEDATQTKLDRILSMLERNDQRVDGLESQIAYHEDNFADVDHRLIELEREKTNAKMEITGLNVPRDTPRHLIKNQVYDFLRSSNINFNEMEIVDAYIFRRRIRNEEQNCITVTFLHEAIKNRIISEKIRLDKSNRTVNVFFGHVLTKANHHLLMNARRAVKDKRILKAWSMSGNIFVLRNQEEGKIQLKSPH